ncbi:MAG: hypothetical protein U1F54_22055 [Burkholderiales bacterium]
MKRIAKSRPSRLASALAAAANSLHRTLAGQTRSHHRRDIVRRTRGSLQSSSVATSLVPAHGGHFDWISDMLREGAQHGSFDAELATPSLASHLFFDNLRSVLQTGSFLADRGQSAPVATAASGYVFTATRHARAPVPLGFVLFKALDESSFELWLCGIQRRYRGRGFCRAMLAAALHTPAGMLAHVARVNRSASDRAAMGKALERCGYRVALEGPHVRWYLRNDAPAALAASLGSAR